MKKTNINGLNCYDSHIKEMTIGDEMHYGWAIGPNENKYQHCWIVRNGKIIDLFNWENHESLGIRLKK